MGRRKCLGQTHIQQNTLPRGDLIAQKVDHLTRAKRFDALGSGDWQQAVWGTDRLGLARDHGFNPVQHQPQFGKIGSKGQRFSQRRHY
jgi:hypothetical protein